MTRPVVIDACCLIDLHKVQLHALTLALPYRFVIPAPVRHSELLNLTDLEWRYLDAAGLETVDPLLEYATEVLEAWGEHAGLSLVDCACLVAARHHENSVLLTADKRLRRAAESEEPVRTWGVVDYRPAIRRRRMRRCRATGGRPGTLERRSRGVLAAPGNRQAAATAA